MTAAVGKAARGPWRLLARRGAAALVALAAERFVSPLLARRHPVAAYGRAMVALERRIWAPSRARGAAYAAAGLLPALGAWAVSRCRRIPAPLSFLGAAGATAVALGRIELRSEALAMSETIAGGDLAQARIRLANLAGRDARRLGPAELSRAVIESVAENTVDATVASVLWALVGGAPGVIAHRCANTMDAMVGHRSARYERFGWASARLDDLAAWLPARIAAGGVMIARPCSAPQAWRLARGEARRHPSPNAGLSEACFAAALGLRLGGPNYYGGRLDERPFLGAGAEPTAGHIAAAVALADHLAAILAAGLLVMVLAGSGRRAR